MQQRPRRELAGQRQRLLTLGATSESHELMACSEFVGPVGSGTAAAQPYQLEVELQVGCPAAGWPATSWQLQASITL